MFSVEDKVKGQKRKVEARKNRVSTDCDYMFHNLTIVSGSGDYLDAAHLQTVFIKLLLI